MALRKGGFVAGEIGMDSVGRIICGEETSWILMDWYSEFEILKPYMGCWKRYLA